MTFAVTAPNGWTCKVSDLSVTANVMNQNASTTTSVTFLGNTGAGDVLAFMCMGY
jgi:hypothetical protein